MASRLLVAAARALLRSRPAWVVKQFFRFLPNVRVLATDKQAFDDWVKALVAEHGKTFRPDPQLDEYWRKINAAYLRLSPGEARYLETTLPKQLGEGQ